MDGSTRTKTDVERDDHPAKVSDALRSGVAVSITTWSGKRLRGRISDRDQAGLLLDVDADEKGEGYAFVPWSSVEQVDIPEVAHRRVKFLQG